MKVPSAQDPKPLMGFPPMSNNRSTSVLIRSVSASSSLRETSVEGVEKEACRRLQYFRSQKPLGIMRVVST